ncbi:MAG: enoyl-CoA hydratase [Rhodobacterales bacterium]|nr:MAG: enoyl-CoA hydratase [Rhodobacterales bacterium]
MSPVSVQREGDLAIVTIDSPPVNATSRAVRQGLWDAVAEVQGARVAILTCAGRTWIAGGDMSEFDGPALEPHLPDVVNAIEESETPFIAALHGTVLGGGFEVAMACAWRIADRATRFGLPEVHVGIIPGAGGSQRAPRLVGMDAAIELACEGKQLGAARIAELGGVDLLADGDVLEAARRFAADLPARPVPVSARDCAALATDAFAKQQSRLTKSGKGQGSPLANLEALQWAALPFADGAAKERARHLKMRVAPESRALRHVFFAERAAAKPAAIQGAAPRPSDRIAIVGGGLMGAGIATAALSAGRQVTLIERDAEAARAAQDRVAGLIDGAVARGKLSEAQRDAQLSALTCTGSYDDAREAQIAIEAVFEDLDVKRQVFAELVKVVSPDAILATNTSYIDPVDISAGIEGQERCIGMHFFSPAHIMKLLEVVRMPATAPDVIATAFAFGKALRKVSVLSGICDGFIGNRMLTAYRRGAEYLLADGAAPQQVDRAMRAAGLPMGPFELQDLTGLQIAWANRKRQAETRPEQERYVTISDTLCEMGRLGQRSGKGWYRYEEGSRSPIPDPEVEAVIVDYSARNGLECRSFTDEEIADRLLAVLANEGARIVEEGIAEDDAAVDVVKIHGYGFPRWRGGPMHLAAQTGWAQVARAMHDMEADSPGSWILADRLKATDAQGEQG